MVQVSVHSGARLDINLAIDWYEGISPDLARQFTLQLWNTFELISEHPEAWLKLGRRVRRAIMERFPYSVIYVPGKDSILVLAVAHAKRKPGYWKDRLKEM